MAPAPPSPGEAISVMSRESPAIAQSTLAAVTRSEDGGAVPSTGWTAGAPKAVTVATIASSAASTAMKVPTAGSSSTAATIASTPDTAARTAPAPPATCADFLLVGHRTAAVISSAAARMIDTAQSAWRDRPGVRVTGVTGSGTAATGGVTAGGSGAGSAGGVTTGGSGSLASACGGSIGGVTAGGSGSLGSAGAGAGSAGRTVAVTVTVAEPVGPSTVIVPVLVESGDATISRRLPTCRAFSHSGAAVTRAATASPDPPSSTSACSPAAISTDAGEAVSRTPASAVDAANDSDRLSSPTRKPRACTAASTTDGFASSSSTASSWTAPSRLIRSPASAVWTATGSAAGTTRRSGDRATRMLPCVPNDHRCGVCRGLARRTCSSAYENSSWMLIVPVPSESASPVAMPSTTADVKTDGARVPSSVRSLPSKAYSTALDAVITTRPEPSASWPWPNESSTATSPPARASMPRSKAPP